MATSLVLQQTNRVVTQEIRTRTFLSKTTLTQNSGHTTPAMSRIIAIEITNEFKDRSALEVEIYVYLRLIFRIYNK